MHVLLKNQMVNTVYVGYDPKEHTAYEVLKFSLERISTKPVRVIPLRRDILTKIGIYTRKHNSISGQDYDEIDGKPFSTQFSFSRFLIPALNMYEGLALYMDSDMYVRAEDSEYLHKGIAKRSFTRDFVLADTLHVEDVTFNDGILQILIKQIIPEEQKPKQLKIK